MGQQQDVVPEHALESRSCQASPGSLAPIFKFGHTPALVDGAINMAMAVALVRERRVDFTSGPALLLGSSSTHPLSSPSVLALAKQILPFQAFLNAVLSPWTSSSSYIPQRKLFTSRQPHSPSLGSSPCSSQQRRGHSPPWSPILGPDKAQSR